MVPTNQIFTTLNFTDVYIELVDSLSQLHAACVWESLALQKILPDKWKKQTEPRPFMMRQVDSTTNVVEFADQRSGNHPIVEGSNGEQPATEQREEVFAIKNAKTIRYLLSQVSTIGEQTLLLASSVPAKWSAFNSPPVQI